MRLTSPTALARCALHAALASCLSSPACLSGSLGPAAIPPALAVSGGGKDYSGMSIEQGDFQGQNLKGKVRSCAAEPTTCAPAGPTIHPTIH